MAFFLVLVRMSSFIVSWPVFGSVAVNSPTKILFALSLSLMVFPVVDWSLVQGELGDSNMIWLALREAFIGLSFGFLARIFFYAINIAGEIVGASMGIANAQLFNPALGARVTSMEQFHLALATLFFLAINGHHILLSGIVESFNLVPLAGESIAFTGFKKMGFLVQEIMVIGFKLAAPVMVSILFLNIAMGVIGRTVPQINVLITSLPINILVGFVVLIVSVPLFLWKMHDLMDLTAVRVFQMLKTY